MMVSDASSDPSRDAVLPAIEANQGEFDLFFGHVTGGEIHRGSSISWSYTGTPWLNTVWGARLPAGRVDAAVTELLDSFRARSAALSWLIGPSTRPTDLGEYLVERYGFVHDATSPGMALDLAHLTEQPPVPSELTIHKGGGILGAGEHQTVERVARQFVVGSGHFLAAMTQTTAFPLPEPGMTRFYVLTTQGIWTAEASEATLGQSKSELSPLFHMGHRVISEIRVVVEKRGE